MRERRRKAELNKGRRREEAEEEEGTVSETVGDRDTILLPRTGLGRAKTLGEHCCTLRQTDRQTNHTVWSEEFEGVWMRLTDKDGKLENEKLIQFI